MAHRDDLEAAHAKIAALQAALDDARGGAPTDDSLRADVARLEMLLSAAHAERRVAEERAEKAEHELGQVRAERARAEREAKKAERAAAAEARSEPRVERDLRSMVTLAQHNRSLPEKGPSKDWPPAGVLCSACADEGERVELVLRPLLGTNDTGGVKLANVICLRCGFTGAKRVT